MRVQIVLIVSGVLLLGLGCSEIKLSPANTPEVCDSTTLCATGLTCDLQTGECVADLNDVVTDIDPLDGGTAVDALTPSDLAIDGAFDELDGAFDELEGVEDETTEDSPSPMDAQDPAPMDAQNDGTSDDAGTETTPLCGDGACKAPSENCDNCPEDCGPCASCDAYCGAYWKHCAHFGEYTSPAQCVQYCTEVAPWEVTKTDVDTEDSLSCRLDSLNKLAGEGDSLESSYHQCRAASRSGNGVCGEVCESFCHLVSKNCQGIGGTDIPTKLGECLSACDELQGMPTGEPGAHIGNSIQCRFTAIAEATFEGAASEETCFEALSISSPLCQGKVPTYSDVQNEFLIERCSGCHGNATSKGGHSLASSFLDAFKPAALCANKSVGACAVDLMLKGTMPQNGETMGPQKIDLYLLWLTGGMAQ